jgi:hypothetical protein
MSINNITPINHYAAPTDAHLEPPESSKPILTWLWVASEFNKFCLGTILLRRRWWKPLYCALIVAIMLALRTINSILRGGRRRSLKMTSGAHSSRPSGTKGWGRSAPPEGSGVFLRAGVFWCLPDSSSVVFVAGKFHLFMQLKPPLYAFWNNPWKIAINQNSWKLSVVTFYSMIFIHFTRKVDGSWYTLTTVNKLLHTYAFTRSQEKVGLSRYIR